jgi:hypothetical protein
VKLEDAVPGQAEAAQVALLDIPEPARFFYVPHYRIDRDYGKFVGLVCRACNRWSDSGHEDDCPALKIMQ